MRIHSLLGPSFAAAVALGLPLIIGHIPTARADPDPNASPTYCTGTNNGAKSGPRRDGQDTVTASADFTCDQSQDVEVIFTITGDGHSWTDDVENRIPAFGNACSPTAPCGGTVDALDHKVGGVLDGQLYTVTATVKIYVSGKECGSPSHCFPFGTPLRTFDLPVVTQGVHYP